MNRNIIIVGVVAAIGAGALLYMKRNGLGPWSPEESGLDEAAAALRATPVLWIGSESFESLTVYGFYKEFSIDLAYPTVSYCSLTIEGLT